MKLSESSSSDQDSSQALLVCYRPKRFTGRGLTPSVYVDGQQVARLDNGRFFSLRIDPGDHQVESSMKKHPPVAFNAHPGEVIYLEMVILPGIWRGGGRMIPAPGESALESIKKLKPLDKKWIKDQRIGFDVELSVIPNGSKVESETGSKQSDVQLTIVDIRSEPSRADVELDGKFVGNTPTTLRLKPGDYKIVVRKEGYRIWERDIAVLPDNHLKLFAELQEKRQD